MKRGQGVSRQHGGEFSPADAMHDFLGGELDVAAMTAAVDPSLHRNKAQ